MGRLAACGLHHREPWLPVNPDDVQVNVAAASADRVSVLAHHRRLIELRHTLPVVAHGDFTMLLPELLVLGNLSDRPAAVDLSGWNDSPVLLRNVDHPQQGVLQPWEARVHRRGMLGG